jgi:hypothetical protein
MGLGLVTLKGGMNLLYLATYFTAGLTSIIYSAFYCAWFLLLRLCGGFSFAEEPSLTNWVSHLQFSYPECPLCNSPRVMHLWVFNLAIYFSR